MKRPETAEEACTLTAGVLAEDRLQLRIECGCGRIRPLLFPAMVRAGLRRSITLGSMVGRLQCRERCGHAPVRVMLLDGNDEAVWWSRMRRPPLPWHIVLVGPDEWFGRDGG